MRLARQYDLNFLATGGRHSVVPTLERLQQGLAINMGNLNSVEIDREAQTLTVGGGVRTSEVLGPVSEAGLEICKSAAQVCPPSVRSPILTNTSYRDMLVHWLRWCDSWWWSQPVGRQHRHDL